MQVRHKTDQNIYVDSDVENTIEFQKFMAVANHKAEFEPDTNYVLHEKSKIKWNSVRKEDTRLKINDFTGKGEKNYFVATVSKRRIRVCNSTGKEYTYCYMITLHPQLTIWNHTPRKINLSIYNTNTIA